MVEMLREIAQPNDDGNGGRGVSVVEGGRSGGVVDVTHESGRFRRRITSARIRGAFTLGVLGASSVVVLVLVSSART